MATFKKCVMVAALAICGLVWVNVRGDGPTTSTAPAVTRENADKLRQQGNYKDAYGMYYSLATDAKDDAGRVRDDLLEGIGCLGKLNRLDEVDDFREKVVAVHGGNWRLLMAAAQSYVEGQSNGYIVAGKFYRGYSRGGGKWVYSSERDRVRALQLMQQALPLLKGQDAGGELAGFYQSLATMLLGGRGYGGAWRLGYLTDISVLPDYDESYDYNRSIGAPVNEDGTPVYHYVPKSWQEAKTDGQRWRWAMMMSMEIFPGGPAAVKLQLADFYLSQFGVQTLADYGWFFGRGHEDSDTKKDESGIYELHTLGEDETIARLASGIKRFKLPDEFNYIKIYQQVAADAKVGNGHKLPALDALWRLFENRRQYPKAEMYLKQALELDPPKGDKDPGWFRKLALDQIVGNWGTFEPIMSQPAGKGATVDFRFRNGNGVSFEAHEIDIPKLLADVKEYLKHAPATNMDWRKMEISSIGWRLVNQDRERYIKNKSVARWDLPLEPKPDHFDKRITVTTPLQKAGAYLLQAKMADGNTSSIVVWLADTVMARKMMEGKEFYYVADAVSGEPVAKANVEFFGYRQRYVQDDNKGRGHYEIDTRDGAEFTDGQGQLFRKLADGDRDFSWLAVATTEQGRLAYTGFNGAWWGTYDQEYNQPKAYVITDRPVYRPGQPVKFKTWVSVAKYDAQGNSPFAGKTLQIQVYNPRSEKILTKDFTADEYGGFDGELDAKLFGKDATLGVYRIEISGAGGVQTAGNSFRLEEYKKPEFEVKVDAPTEPVMLGEKVTATINAKYYFGAPVTEGKVKYRIMRTSYSDTWYPVGLWDWFYGRGYWWFASDYNWYPGWQEWGCKRPLPGWWWQGHSREQPEIVAQAEVPVGKDGQVKVEFDTALAKAVHGDSDHKYEIMAEVTDQSRRTIVGTGSVLVARKPFKVYAWVNRGHYRMGDTIEASFRAQTLDNKPVKGKGKLRLLKISYEKDKDSDGLKPVEKEVQAWDLDTNEEGVARQQMKASQGGQFRLSYTLADDKGHSIEGGYVFCVAGEGFDSLLSKDFRFNDLELVPDKREYEAGEKAQVMINTNRPNSWVLLFPRPAQGIYLAPKLIHLEGKSVTEAVEVTQRDMPNFFVEALTVSGGQVFTEVREIVVPPAKRVLNVEVKAAEPRYKPGQKASVQVKVTDSTGEPYRGSLVLTMYDKAVEYISGGSNVPEIKEFFWKWRRHHYPVTATSLKSGDPVIHDKDVGMGYLGVFGYVYDVNGKTDADGKPGSGGWQGGEQLAFLPKAAPSARGDNAAGFGDRSDKDASIDQKREVNKSPEAAAQEASGPLGEQGPAMVEPTVRSKFADTAFWAAAITTDEKGLATVDVTMPENLTTWKTRVWAMGQGTRVGEGTTEAVTSKDLIVRLQAPRFFVQKDEVVLSANVHNYLKTKKSVKAVLELADNGAFDGKVVVGGKSVVVDKANIKDPGKAAGGNYLTNEQVVEVDANGEKRVDWTVKVAQPGLAVVRMKALTDEESDAMEMSFPVYIHGMLKTDSFSGGISPDKTSASIEINVPKERLPEQSRLEVRYSPSLALAMVDALPYMVSYPYGCTEQTLNRFLPTVITQKTLIKMGLDLKDIQKKRTNLNAQEIGDDAARAKDWAYTGGYMSRDTAQVKEPVFDSDAVAEMVKIGLEKLTAMQNSDGGWGWWSGMGEVSYPHTTAIVVHGLQVAKDNDVALVPGVLGRGLEWLKGYQAGQLKLLRQYAKDNRTGKAFSDDLDSLVFMVLVDAKIADGDMTEMGGRLYTDRNHLAVYSKAMLGLSMHKLGKMDERDMLLKNVKQFLVQDEENQTAYLKLPDGFWWCWYGSENEAHAYFLKLLLAAEPKSEIAPRLVKYLINNRRHGSYWNSTRDTAIVLEAMADYIKATSEDKPDMLVEIFIDGKQVKEVKIDKDNLFSFDNKLVLTGDQVATGKHKVELRKKGTGPLYFNAYMTNFTLEDPITKAGLEIKVDRKFYKLVQVDKKVHDEGSRGQVLDKRVLKYERQELKDGDVLKSGDLVEIEMEIDSKNDYEYIVFEDMKAAGMEPVEVRSGYNGNDMHAYVEFRDERVSFFVRDLARGKHSVSYRLRAEIPGKFSALPTKASAMYAPELKGNSDEFKIGIKD